MDDICTNVCTRTTLVNAGPNVGLLLAGASTGGGRGHPPNFIRGGYISIRHTHKHLHTHTHTHTLFTVTSPPAELGFVSRYQIIANFGTSIFKVFAGRAPTPPAKRFAASALTCRGLPLAKFQDLETLSYHYLYMVSSDTQGSAGGGG